MTKLAVITGADGDMGQVITTALAREGFKIIMACKRIQKAESVCTRIKKETQNEQIEVRYLDLASLTSVDSFTDSILKEGNPVHRLINNAGLLSTHVRKTEDGLETLVSVNYIAHYYLTRKLIPLMSAGSRIVSTVSCTVAIGKIDSAFFTNGKKGRFFRIPVYSNTKLALYLFTRELAKLVEDKGILVNAADPGIVSTNIITMNAWFDPLTDIFYRPFIKTPEQGAATTIHLALSPEVEGQTGLCYVNKRIKKFPKRVTNHPAQKRLWDETEKLLKSKGFAC